MKLMMKVPWNTMSHEKLYNNDDNTVLYNEYMMKIV